MSGRVLAFSQHHLCLYTCTSSGSMESYSRKNTAQNRKWVLPWINLIAHFFCSSHIWTLCLSFRAHSQTSTETFLLEKQTDVPLIVWLFLRKLPKAGCWVRVGGFHHFYRVNLCCWYSYASLYIYTHYIRLDNEATLMSYQREFLIGFGWWYPYIGVYKDMYVLHTIRVISGKNKRDGALSLPSPNVISILLLWELSGLAVAHFTAFT